MDYGPHEYSLVFPDMSADQFKRLAADIEANGLIHDIVLYEDKILDGRHRYRACLEQGIEPRFHQYTGPDPAAYVGSENAARRHLSNSQLSLVAAKLAEVESVRAKARRTGRPPSDKETEENKSLQLCRDLGEPGEAAVKAAKDVGIGRRNVYKAIKVLKTGTPEVVKAVEAGIMKINEAERIAELKPASQKRIMAIDDKRERSSEISKTLAQSRAKRNAYNKPAPPPIPGTPFVRHFLGRLELMTNGLASDFKLKSGEQIADQFLTEFDWNESQLRAQLEHITPLLRGLSSVYDAVVGRNSAAA